tara:strand:+ start:2134 stop:2397 length:264 start_codon:yes stop_codon:yes gene_type:complete
MNNIKLSETDLEVINNNKLFFPPYLLEKKIKSAPPETINPINKANNISIFKPFNNSRFNTLNLGVNKKIIESNQNKTINRKLNFKLF